MLTAQEELKDADDKLAELAECRLSYIAFFSLLSPIVSYSYTGRFKALCIFIVFALMIMLGVFQLSSDSGASAKKTRTVLGIGIAAAATIDNTRAVLTARKQNRDRLSPLQYVSAEAVKR